MDVKHNFVQLAETQLASGTMYCAGLDPHSFGPEMNSQIYQINGKNDILRYYLDFIKLMPIKSQAEKEKYARVLAGVR